jgi:hypothetical protein
MPKIPTLLIIKVFIHNLFQTILLSFLPISTLPRLFWALKCCSTSLLAHSNFLRILIHLQKRVVEREKAGKEKRKKEFDEEKKAKLEATAHFQHIILNMKIHEITTTTTTTTNAPSLTILEAANSECSIKYIK